MNDGPGYLETLGLLALGAVVAAFCGWRAERPHNPARGPRMIPWTLLMLTAVVWCLVMLVHLVNLFGIETGARRF